MPAILLAGVLPLAPSPLQAQRAGSAVGAPPGARFVASSRGQVFYPVDCSAWRDLSRRNLVFFRSAREAESRGYAPTRNRRCREPASVATLAPRSPAAPRAIPPRARAWIADARMVGVCVVERIVDGDTLDCEGGVRVRLLLIDAPERRQGYALRASLALEEILPVGDSAAVELDVEPRDRYGRLLAHLHRLDGLWVNRALVRRGYAVPLVYPPNVRHVEAIRAAADSARAEALGLWAEGPATCLPVDFRAGRCR